MASSIQLKTAASPDLSCSYQNDDALGIGQITRSIAVEHLLEVNCDLVWRDEWTIAAAGHENMDTDALTGNWCGSAISINFTTIHAVVIEVEKLASTVANDMTLSVTGGVAGGGTFPLVGSTLPILGEGLTMLGSVLGWTCGTTLVIVITNGAAASRTVRALIAGDL